jgi:hypothetical protein
MTAASGILHEEFHSTGFTKAGGPFRMVQLWVNLPAKDKMSAPGYQAITSADIPVVSLADQAGKARIIAGEFEGTRGPARTFTPINMWDLRLTAGASLNLDLPEGHTAALVVLSGHITVGGSQAAGEAEMVLLSPRWQRHDHRRRWRCDRAGADRGADRRADCWLWPVRDEQRNRNPSGNRGFQQRQVRRHGTGLTATPRPGAPHRASTISNRVKKGISP